MCHSEPIVSVNAHCPPDGYTACKIGLAAASGLTGREAGLLAIHAVQLPNISKSKSSRFVLKYGKHRTCAVESSS